MIKRSFINRKGVLIIGLLLTSFFAFSQKANFRRVENAHIIDAITKDTISSHSSDTEAQQELLNLQFANREVYMLGAIYKVDITKPECINDTIYIGDNWEGLTNMHVIDTITKLFFKYGSVSGPTTNVLNQMGELYVVEKDSSMTIPNYVFQAKLERYKEWPTAKTTYKLVETPFFFYESDSVVSLDTVNGVLRYRTFANKMHCIAHIVNGVDIGVKYCGPGLSEYAGGSRRHTNTIRGLDISKDNLIEFVAYSLDSTTVLGKRQYLLPKQP